MTPLTPAAADTAGGPADADDTRVKAQATDAAVKFEAHFVKNLIDQMRSSARALSEDGDDASHRANDDMLDIADGLVADALARQRAFGIADMMLSQVLPAKPQAPAADLSSGPARSLKKSGE